MTKFILEMPEAIAKKFALQIVNHLEGVVSFVYRKVAR